MSAAPPTELDALRALDVLRRQREGLDKGRAIANAQRKREARSFLAQIVDYAMADAHAGNPTRGRAKRIAAKLRGRRSERHIRRLLASVALPQCGRKSEA